VNNLLTRTPPRSGRIAGRRSSISPRPESSDPEWDRPSDQERVDGHRSRCRQGSCALQDPSNTRPAPTRIRQPIKGRPDPWAPRGVLVLSAVARRWFVRLRAAHSIGGRIVGVTSRRAGWKRHGGKMHPSLTRRLAAP
jgi:hypothetical protein